MDSEDQIAANDFSYSPDTTKIKRVVAMEMEKLVERFLQADVVRPQYQQQLQEQTDKEDQASQLAHNRDGPAIKKFTSSADGKGSTGLFAHAALVFVADNQLSRSTKSASHKESKGSIEPDTQRNLASILSASVQQQLHLRQARSVAGSASGSLARYPGRQRQFIDEETERISRIMLRTIHHKLN